MAGLGESADGTRKWALVKTLPRLCDLNQCLKDDAEKFGEKSDRLPVGVYIDGLTPLFLKQTRKSKLGSYNNQIGTGTGYQLVTGTGAVTPAHLLPFPSLTSNGMVSLYKKILNNESPFPLDGPIATRERTYAFEHNSRLREHFTLREKHKQVHQDVVEGKVIPKELNPFIDIRRPYYIHSMGQTSSNQSPYSYIYAFNKSYLPLPSSILEILTKLVDSHPLESLSLGVCQVALLNYIWYDGKGESLKEKFAGIGSPGKIDHITFIIAFHHLLAYTEWTGVAFHPNPLRFAAAFAIHEKSMGRPVPQGYLWKTPEEGNPSSIIVAGLAQLKDATPICALTPGDLIGSTVNKFRPSELAIEPYIPWDEYEKGVWHRNLAIVATVRFLGNVRNIGNSNYLNRNYTHRLIPFSSTKPEYEVARTYDRTHSFQNINGDIESLPDVKDVSFPACDLNGYTRGSGLDCLTISQRAAPLGSPEDDISINSIPEVNQLDEVLQLCCSSAEQLEGAAPAVSSAEEEPARGQKRDADSAGLEDIHEAARTIDPIPEHDEKQEEKLEEVVKLVSEGRLELPPTPPADGAMLKHSDPKVVINGKTFVSQEGILSYLKAKGHREGVDYALVDRVPVSIDWENDDE